MTLKELSQLYWLKREIEADKKELENVRRDAYAPKSPNLSGMPSGGGDNRIERDVAKITYLEDLIAAKIKRCETERIVLEEYIMTIPDSLTRQVFEYRFVNGLPWSQVAANIGGNNTENGVKQLCSRYIRSHQSD